MNDEIALTTLRTSFRDSSTKSMPIAGMIFWAGVLLSYGFALIRMRRD